jgi:hypothetical protein
MLAHWQGVRTKEGTEGIKRISYLIAVYITLTSSHFIRRPAKPT